MVWPLASHFSSMLQNPQVAFRDPELKKCQIERNDQNQPRPRAGQFAVVYRALMANGGSMCVRVFTSETPERRERYEAVSKYLESRQLQSLVHFKYHDKGVRAQDGKWYPLVTMEWVPGETLFQWVKSQCINQNCQALLQAADRWLKLVDELSNNRIAHGDLQHANVMVTDGDELKLVDYDCMCVPALEGRRNLELGVEPYQHPERNYDTPLSPELDHFSALFILVALRALAAAPALWHTYVDGPRYDKLLFHREDLFSPDRSSLYQDLMRSPDPEVGHLAKRLAELVRVTLREVPAVQQVLNSYDKIEQFLRLRKWDEAVSLLERRGRWNDAPGPLKPLIQEAHDRVTCRKKLEQAVQSGDEVAMQTLYVPRLLDDYPEAMNAVLVARKAPQVAPIIRQLERERESGRWRKMAEMLKANQALLSNRRSAEPLKAAVQKWQEPNALCDEIEKLLRQPECNLEALDVSWRRLTELGGHPELEPQRAFIERLVTKHAAWQAFQRLPSAVTKRHDTGLVNAWQEDLFRGWEPAEKERPRVDAAVKRLQAVHHLAGLATYTPLTRDGEQKIKKAGRAFPNQYEHGLETRVREAKERLDAIAALEWALDKDPPSDLAIAERVQAIEQLKGQGLIAPSQQKRVELALKRVRLIGALRNLEVGAPPHQLDPQILPIWKDELLAGCQDAEPWRAAFHGAVERRKLLQRLKAAISKGDDPTIAKVATDARFDGYEFSDGLGPRIKAANERLSSALEFIAALRDRDGERFFKQFTAAVVGRYPEMFAPYRALLREWTKSEILPRKKLGLDPPAVHTTMAPAPGAANTYLVRWVWPAPRFTDQCLLAVCSKSPSSNDDPDTLQKHIMHCWPIDRKSWVDAAGSRKIHTEASWRGSYLVVWAVVDLGFQAFHSEPLVLGRLPSTA
jgi:serine/threonine protein kinase